MPKWKLFAPSKLSFHSLTQDLQQPQHHTSGDQMNCCTLPNILPQPKHNFSRYHSFSYQFLLLIANSGSPYFPLQNKQGKGILLSPLRPSCQLPTFRVHHPAHVMTSQQSGLADGLTCVRSVGVRGESCRLLFSLLNLSDAAWLAAESAADALHMPVRW
jgi:hypothetical protein